MAPALVGVKRRVEKEKVKDRLRRWVVGERRGGVLRIAAERGWVDANTDDGEEGAVCKGRDRERLSVRFLVQRFARRAAARGPHDQHAVAAPGRRWGRAAAGGCRVEEPTRAHVLGLRKFWEKVEKEGRAS